MLNAFKVSMSASIFAAVLVFVGSGAFAEDEEFPFDDYFFHWVVCKSGDSKLAVEKDQDGTVIKIRDKHDSFELTPAEGVELSVALAKTSDMAKKLKGTKNKREVLNVGTIEVIFATSEGSQFLVAVTRGSKKPSFETIVLERDAATAFAKVLKKSVELAAKVDKKIDL